MPVRRPAGSTVILVFIGVLVAGLLSGCGRPVAAVAEPPGLRVHGNALLGPSGQPVVLRGVNRSGTEYMCIQGHGIFDGPSDDASIQAMASWGINVVRVPLNESCWLGINDAPAAYAGEAYRAAIVDYVNRLHVAGLFVILDLHWSGPGKEPAKSQRAMADADHAPDFWTSVAGTFRNDDRVIFDLFNEPLGISWECWRDGGECGVGFEVAGMQDLVDAVRATGATQALMLGGLAWSNDLSSWLTFKPTDPVNRLIASWHSYNFNACSSAACWDTVLAPVAAAVPLVAGELGEDDCAHGYIDQVMPWLDAHNAGYLGWAWATHDCKTFPALIKDYDGTPTDFGAGLKDHLAAPPSTEPSPTSSAEPSPTSRTEPVEVPSPTATRTEPVEAPTPSAEPSTRAEPVEALKVTTSVNADAAPYWWEAALDFTPSGEVTNLELVVTVKRTSGLKPGSFYTDAPGGALNLTQESTGSSLTYRAVLGEGSTLPAGHYRAGVQYSGDGTIHPVTGDTYVLSAIVAGRKITTRGHF